MNQHRGGGAEQYRHRHGAEHVPVGEPEDQRAQREQELLNDWLQLQRRDWMFVFAVRPIQPVHVRCVEVHNDDHLYLASRSMVPTRSASARAVAGSLRSRPVMTSESAR